MQKIEENPLCVEIYGTHKKPNKTGRETVILSDTNGPEMKPEMDRKSSIQTSQTNEMDSKLKQIMELVNSAKSKGNKKINVRCNMLKP